ncbi:MAG: hypothetical protein FJ100_00455 [Deltaproteobacteria bacterium]|nr:hypothetical protein [Deltaproteobacteria bacterium]
MNLAEFRSWSKPQLADALAAGHALAPGDLAGWQYQGISLGLPRWVERLTWSVFVKAFAADGDRVVGWNVRIVQGDDRLLEADAQLVLRSRAGKPWEFGHFHVTQLDEWQRTRARLRRPCGPGVMLDYVHPRNAAVDPTRLVRDPLVALRPNDPTLLLGVSLVEVAGRHWPTGSWFVLQRWRPLPPHCSDP